VSSAAAPAALLRKAKQRGRVLTSPTSYYKEEKEVNKSSSAQRLRLLKITSDGASAAPSRRKRDTRPSFGPGCFRTTLEKRRQNFGAACPPERSAGGGKILPFNQIEHLKLLSSEILVSAASKDEHKKINQAAPCHIAPGHI